MGKKLIFVSGGARSGKSSFVENWAINNGNKVLFIATAERSDEEMTERIEAHIQSRPESWKTIETPLNISQSFNLSLIHISEPTRPERIGVSRLRL